VASVRRRHGAPSGRPSPSNRCAWNQRSVASSCCTAKKPCAPWCTPQATAREVWLTSAGSGIRGSNADESHCAETRPGSSEDSAGRPARSGRSPPRIPSVDSPAARSARAPAGAIPLPISNCGRTAQRQTSSLPVQARSRSRAVSWCSSWKGASRSSSRVSSSQASRPGRSRVIRTGPSPNASGRHSSAPRVSPPDVTYVFKASVSIPSGGAKTPGPGGSTAPSVSRCTTRAPWPSSQVRSHAPWKRQTSNSPCRTSRPRATKTGVPTGIPEASSICAINHGPSAGQTTIPPAASAARAIGPLGQAGATTTGAASSGVKSERHRRRRMDPSPEACTQASRCLSPVHARTGESRLPVESAATSSSGPTGCSDCRSIRRSRSSLQPGPKPDRAR